MKTFKQFIEEGIKKKIISTAGKAILNVGRKAKATSFSTKLDTGYKMKLNPVKTYRVDPKDLDPKINLVRSTTVGGRTKNSGNTKRMIDWKATNKLKGQHNRAVIDQAAKDAKSGKIPSKTKKDVVGQRQFNRSGFDSKEDVKIKKMLFGKYGKGPGRRKDMSPPQADDILGHL